jgi:hypothetical protein
MLTEEGVFSIIDAYLRLASQGEKIRDVRPSQIETVIIRFQAAYATRSRTPLCSRTFSLRRSLDILFDFTAA